MRAMLALASAIETFFEFHLQIFFFILDIVLQSPSSLTILVHVSIGADGMGDE